jgi:ATP-binding cassette subfamily B protein
MPQGYNTMLGRMFGEFTLSEGQWQQIALARAFARDATLLILDEPTSNLDARSEYEVFSRFQEIAKGRTTILISHRFSTVSMADRILVMDKGQIVEQGTHQELINHGGHYASLYQLHLRQMNNP